MTFLKLYSQKLGHKDRLCAAPLITRDRNSIAAPYLGGGFDKIDRFGSAAVCEAHLQPLFTSPIEFKKNSRWFAFSKR